MPGHFLAMSRVIESIERRQMRPNIPQFKAGDTVRVHFQVIEGERRRTQVFEGIVIKRQGSGVHETFTVRKQSFGVGVERTFPIHSPKIERIELAAIGIVRRAKLYYLRDKVGKRARVRTKAGAIIAPTPVAAPAEPQPEPVEAEPGSDDLAVGHEEAEAAAEATPGAEAAGASDAAGESDAARESDAAGESPPGDESAPETERE
jgi:large subunit ribosomal protein L19